MRSLVVSDAVLTARKITVCQLIEINNNGTYYRYTNGTAVVTYSGKTYLKQPFQIGQVVSSADGSQAADVIFEDQNDALKTIALAYDFREWDVIVDEAHLNADGSVVGLVNLINGRSNGIDFDISATNDQATLSISPQRAPEQSLGPAWEYGLACPFRFKDAFCGYGTAAPGAGPDIGHTSCSRNLADCIDRANTPRFGGAPDAPTPGSIFFWGIFKETISVRTYPVLEKR